MVSAWRPVGAIPPTAFFELELGAICELILSERYSRRNEAIAKSDYSFITLNLNTY
jgi:hypothetical protein